MSAEESESCEAKPQYELRHSSIRPALRRRRRSGKISLQLVLQGFSRRENAVPNIQSRIASPSRQSVHLPQTSPHAALRREGNRESEKRANWQPMNSAHSCRKQTSSE